MRFLLLAAALTLATAERIHAQTAADSAAIRAASLDYIEGFYEGDSTKMLRSIRPSVYKYGYARDSSGYRGMQMAWPQFLAYARRVKESGRRAPATAVKQVQLLDVLDQTAAVKVTATWGIDYLLLAREGDRWMITHVLWQSAPRP